ncbi:Uncharacterized protein DAT39_002412 [Clarias magur]|uniref:Uncharacterized protein n=1 Tax=Clarias magur TaxID=1594786 RepID=A0A8J4U976_CLAMG|nr:Uncharacterized protein DAT39_002412 [Clarias magur]
MAYYSPQLGGAQTKSGISQIPTCTLRSDQSLMWMLVCLLTAWAERKRDGDRERQRDRGFGSGR